MLPICCSKRNYARMRKIFTIEHTLNIGRYSERSIRLLQHAHGNIQIGVFCFAESNACPFLFPSFYFCPLLLLPPLNHRIDTSKCNRTFNILLSAIGRSKRIPDDQSTPRMPLSTEQVLALLSRLPQRRYRYYYSYC